MDFGRQVGRENRAKRLQKWHRKNDEKMKGNKMAKKSQQEVPTPLGTWGPGPWGGGRGRGITPPQRVETRRVERRGVENRHLMLNHPSPEG